MFYIHTFPLDHVHMQMYNSDCNLTYKAIPHVITRKYEHVHCFVFMILIILIVFVVLDCSFILYFYNIYSLESLFESITQATKATLTCQLTNFNKARNPK